MAKYKVIATYEEAAVVDLGDLPPRLAEIVLEKLGYDGLDSWGLCDLGAEFTTVGVVVTRLDKKGNPVEE